MTDKKLSDQKTFIENVNKSKKDKRSGNKPRFAWMKGKAK
jgi:hypothetical protein